MNTGSLDLSARLRVLCWARLAAAGFFVAVGPWAPAVLVPTASPGLLRVVLTLVVASSAALLLVGRAFRPRVVAWLLCVLDASLITAVVAATGGPRSILVFLYVLLVMSSCLLLPRAGVLVIALVSSVLYATIVLARNVVPVLAFGAPPDSTIALDLLAILATAGTLAVVSIVGGGLAERILLSQRELERERRTLGNLQAFSDVIFQSVGTGLVALDREHRITAFNRAAESITGVSASAALGGRWADVFGPEASLPEIAAVIAGRTHAATRHEIEMRRPDGTVVPLRVDTWALEAPDGTRLGCIAACEDLGPARAMEARVRQADRLATLARMAANIAHEIRNPLASLSGAVEALTRGAVTAQARSGLGDIVARESDRLNRLIASFLEYARPAPLRIEPIDAASLLEDVLSGLSPRLTAGGIKTVRAFPASLPLEADPERLRQVVTSLCLNALAAMPAGGELRMDARARAGWIEVAIADTGDGIPADDLPRVFEPFFEHRHDVTGLGLALVHRIVQEHGGELTVRSERGVGTELVLRLPERHD